jgi:hypothetical protein
MPEGVKRRTTPSRTRISSKHQVTIAMPAFEAAGFRAGEMLAVRAVGPGQVMLSSLDALLDKHRGRLDSGGELGRITRDLRSEWE